MSAVVLYSNCPLCRGSLKTLDADTRAYQLCLSCGWQCATGGA